MTLWCILATMATYPCSRPSATHISHSGLLRSRGRLAMLPTSSASSCSVPGAGTPTRKRWLSMSKSGSSMRTGWASWKGTVMIRSRNGGRRCIRLVSMCLTVSIE